MAHWTNIARLKLGGLLNRLEGGDRLGATRTQARLLANRYQVKALLGEGGMGRVLLVDDVAQNREVALKILLGGNENAARPEAKSTLDVAFRQEFYTLSKLQHPGTVQVFDYGILPTGERYLTMEVVRGRDLRELVRQGPMPIKDVYRVLGELGQVLGFIHSRLFVHCDIKADNIRVTDRGATKLMDFGLMHPLGTPSGGTVRGTPAYLAPEVARGGVIDGRTDLYSLGVLAFELVTGKLPFSGKLRDLIEQHLHEDPPRPSSLRAEVPKGLEELILKCLAKDPDERYEDAAGFLQALSGVSGRAIEPQTTSQRTSYLSAIEVVGRDRELARLEAAFRALESGKGSALLLGAPAGVGKTRLLDEFLLKAKLADVPSVLGQCRREGLRPLRPVTQALAGLLAKSPPELLAKVAPPLVSSMPELARQGFEPRSYPDAVQERAAIFEAIITWVREASAKGPLVMVLEDLHWADAATLELINALARELRQTQAMVLGTFRNDEVDRSSLLFNCIDAGEAELLEIAPLSRDDLAAMVTMMLRGIELPASFFDSLFRVTQGNCFFATESLRALLEDGSVAQRHGRWAVAREDLKLPESIADAVSKRLSSLPPEVLQLATVASVAGRVLDLDLLENVSGFSGEKLFAHLDEMVERQFVSRVDELLLFTHDTVRDAIYRRLPEEERRTLHRRIGEKLEQRAGARPEEQAASLAHHFSRSDDPVRSARYLLLAGEQALKVRALTDASGLLVQACRVLETVDYPDKESVQIAAWAHIVDCTFANLPEVGAEYADKLISHWQSVVDVGKASRTMRKMMGVVNRLPRPLRRKIKGKIYADRPFDAKTRVPFVVLPQLLQYSTLKAFAHGFLNQWSATFQELDRSRALIPDVESIFYAGGQAVRALMFGLKGEPLACSKAAREAFEVAERNQETIAAPATFQIYGNCLLLESISDSFNAGKIDQKRVERALQVAQEHELLELMFQARWPLHVRACQTGEASEWRRARAELLDAVRRMGYPPFHESRLYYWDPLFHLEQGKLEEGLAAIARLERLGKQVTDFASIAQVHAFRAMAALEKRDFAVAQKELEASVALSRERELATLNRWSPLLAEVFLQRGDRAKAVEWLEKEVLPKVSSESLGTPISQAIAFRVYGEALGGAKGVEQATRALEVARENGIVIQQGFIQLTLAKLTFAEDRRRASEHLAAAEAAFERAENPFQLARLRDFRARLALGATA